MPSEEELKEAFAKWTKDQESRGNDWQGKLERESQLAEKGLGSRVVGFHCPWCRYKTLYYSGNNEMYFITCKLPLIIECLDFGRLEELKKDK